MTASDESIAAAVLACAAADDKQGTGLAILDLSELLHIVDLFVLSTAANDRQLKTISDEIERRLREIGRKPIRREGSAESGWVLLDYGDIVCHVFDEERRLLYSLERLWADAPQRDPATGAVLEAMVPGFAEEIR